VYSGGRTRRLVRMLKKLLITTVLALGVLAAGAGAASASSITRDPDGGLRYEGINGVDLVTVSYDEEPGFVRFTYIGADPVLGDVSCRIEPGFGTYCDLKGVPAVRVDTGLGNDSIGIGDGPLAVPTVVYGGPGNDRFDGSDAGDDVFYGGEGDDNMLGRGGADLLDGGPGNDVIEGGAGGDRLLGGDGNDELKPDPIDGVFGDVVDGGPGVDMLDAYSSVQAVHTPVNLTLSGGADDGHAGEGDDIVGVERVRTYEATTFVGTEGPDEIWAWSYSGGSSLNGGGGDDSLQGWDGDDRFDGGSGNDRIVGGYGNDTITPGPGTDTVIADATGAICGEFECRVPYGNDVIYARDGERDTIDCGIGTDTVYADAIDVLSGCEKVEIGPVSGGGGPDGGKGGTAKARLAFAKAGLGAVARKGLAVTLSGFAPGKVTIAVRLGRKLLGSTRTKLDAGEAKTVRVRFDRRAKRVLGSRRKATLTVAVGKVSRQVTLRR
jgi:Ca2+-binding RTX toxin-like protein